MEDKEKTQYDLIREDIDLIDKYKNDEHNLIGLINDILLHIKSAEIQNETLQQELSKANDKLKKIEQHINFYGTDEQQNNDTVLRIILKNILEILKGE